MQNQGKRKTQQRQRNFSRKIPLRDVITRHILDKYLRYPKV